jgi:hypothetical protein
LRGIFLAKVSVISKCDPGADFCRSFPCLMRSSSIAGVVALILCGLCGSACAQRYTFHDYGQSDGLKNLNTRCFLQDTIGFLWVCTEDGLFHFDGSVFERMPLDSRDGTYLTGITQDAAGRIWVAAIHALLYYDSLGPHPVRGAGEPFEFDLHASLSAAPDDPGRMYFVSHHTLMVAQRSPKDEWQVFPYFAAAVTVAHPELKDITFAYAKPNGQLWLGCGLGLCFIPRITPYGASKPWRLHKTDTSGAAAITAKSSTMIQRPKEPAKRQNCWACFKFCPTTRGGSGSVH